MTNDDRLLGYRLQLFAWAERTSVTDACRTFGIHRSTYYAWKRRVERTALRSSGPESAADPRCRTPCRPWSRTECSPLRSPPRPRAAAGGLGACPGEVGRDRGLPRHGLARPAPPRALDARASLRARGRLPRSPRAAREPESERHIEADRPGELVGMDCFLWDASEAPRERSGSSPPRMSAPRLVPSQHPGEMRGGRSLCFDLTRRS